MHCLKSKPPFKYSESDRYNRWLELQCMILAYWVEKLEVSGSDLGLPRKILYFHSLLSLSVVRKLT